MCGPLNLSNNVDFHVDAGAVIRLLLYGSWPGEPYTGTVMPLINGSGLTNIAVTGPGLIDGQGAPWWLTYETNNRPIILSLSSCSEVSLEGFTSSNPPVANYVSTNANPVPYEPPIYRNITISNVVAYLSTLFTYGGVLSGSLPILDSLPAGYNYSWNTNLLGQVNLEVTLPAPTNLMALNSTHTTSVNWIVNPGSGAVFLQLIYP